jgi:hypothetical protein
MHVAVNKTLGLDLGLGLCLSRCKGACACDAGSN